jgi:acetyl esterase/lipase
MRRKILTLLGTALLLTAFAREATLAWHPYRPPIAPAAKPMPHVFLNVPYGPFLDHGANTLDLYLPTVGSPPYPVIILIHGGGWTAGDKSGFLPLLLVRNGYATASINYRLGKNGIFYAQIADCKAAVTWIRKHGPSLNLDPNKIGVWGASAGGHLAALLGTTGDAKLPVWAGPINGTSNKVDAVCDWCGPTDLISISAQLTDKTKMSGPLAALLGGPPEVRPDRAKEASPVTYAHPGCPPFLIMHGDQDQVVPLAQSKEFSEVLKNCHVDCTLDIIAAGRHNFYSQPNEQKVVDFFDRTLKHLPSKPSPTNN